MIAKKISQLHFPFSLTNLYKAARMDMDIVYKATSIMASRRLGLSSEKIYHEHV